MATEALGSAISGLRVAQRALDVTANNIANASTDGYTRKILPQEAMIAGEMGVGVRYGEVQRYVDQTLQRDYRIQLGVDSNLETRQNYLSRIVALHGSTDAQTNVGAQLGALLSSFVTLSNDPNSRIAQMSVIDTAQRVATSFNTLSNQMLATRNEIQTKLTAEVNALNTSLKQIAEYNKKIQAMENTGRSTAAIQDQRDVLIRSVAKQLDISYYTDGGGTVVLQTKNGQVLVDTEARNIDFSGGLLTPSTLYPNGAGGIIIQTTDGGGYDLAAVAPGGSIGALLQLRDQELPSYMAQLDELAYKMMVRFNDQNLRLFTDKGGIIPVNDPAAYAGIAAAIQVNPLVLTDPSYLQQGTSGPSQNPGSNTVIMNVVNYTFGRARDALGTPNEPFVFDQTGYDRNISFNILSDPNASLTEFARAMIDRQAADFNNAKSDFKSERQYMQEVEKRMLDSSAVNTDEEMTKMIELQKSYAASAKMVTTLDELFRDLLNAI